MIRVNNYTKEFAENKGIFNIDLSLEKGTVYGLIGPNGAGKTTLITALEGLYNSKGCIEVFGNTVCRDFMVDVSSMLDKASLLDLKLKEIGAIYESFCSDFDTNKFHDLLKRFSLDNRKTKLSKLSKGENLSVRIAVALSRNAKVYLFDEPLSGIDVIKRDVILDSIFEVMDEDKIIVISSHELHDIDKRIDELVFLKEGRVIMQKPLDELKDANQMSLVELYKEILKN
jgi:ABC-2 type transport system ATP-binding protein